ncbi:hypothetical protein MtrunA17_Chr3g0103811 [Medicago truncatula]|uniref:Transmembrane protein n=1 Tax=Medicago truncatula TaxID=3880 RepID=A0A396IPN1_MEDTR|nr:hypothetical protein MtrunA17_Chr3g0103811 [Medicago truncatula]
MAVTVFLLACSVVCHSITNDILQEDLQDTSGFFIDQTTDSLNTTSSCQSTNSRLGDTLDVITKNLSMPLCTSLSESLTSLTTT